MARPKSTSTNNGSEDLHTIRCLTFCSFLRWLIAVITTFYLVPLHLSCHSNCSACQSTKFLGGCCFSSGCFGSCLSSLFTKESFCKAWNVFLNNPVSVLRHSAVINLVTALILVRVNGRSRLIATLKGLVVMVLGTILLHVTAILYGANLFKSWERTSGWAFYSSALVIFPLALRTGFDKESYERLLFSRQLTSYAEWLQTADFFGYIIGAWAGCIVIPLDWQRKWQEWPIPNVISGLIFYGLVVALGPWIYQLILKRQQYRPLAGSGDKGTTAVSKKSSRRSSVSPKKSTTASPRKASRSISPSKRASKSLNLPKRSSRKVKEVKAQVAAPEVAIEGKGRPKSEKPASPKSTHSLNLQSKAARKAITVKQPEPRISTRRSSSKSGRTSAK